MALVKSRVCNTLLVKSSCMYSIHVFVYAMTLCRVKEMSYWTKSEVYRQTWTTHTSKTGLLHVHALYMYMYKYMYVYLCIQFQSISVVYVHVYKSLGHLFSNLYSYMYAYTVLYTCTCTCTCVCTCIGV